ncbi:hypothetical protein ACOME3_004234 [Neoechinorhynchus agilis]
MENSRCTQFKLNLLNRIQDRILSSECELKDISGHIINLISSDVSRSVNFFNSFHELWCLPVQILIVVCILYVQLGLAFIPGLVLTIALLALNRFIAKYINKFNVKMLTAKDERLLHAHDLLSNALSIKYNKLEGFVESRITGSRIREMEQVRNVKYLDSICVFLWAFTPVLLSSITFSVYTLLTHKHLNAPRAFSCLNWLGMLIAPLNSFPWVISGIIESRVSYKRIMEFLNSVHSSKRLRISPTIKIDGQQFCVDNRDCVIMESIDINRGDLVVIDGPIGSGKSTFLRMLVNSLDHKVGYFPQEPWILNESIRDNVVLNKLFDEEKYRSVLTRCGLDIDLLVCLSILEEFYSFRKVGVA